MGIGLKRNEILFYIAFILYYIGVFFTYVETDYGETIKKVMVLLTAGCLMVNLVFGFTRSINIRSVKLTAVIFVFIFAAAILYRDFFIIIMFLFGINLYFMNSNIRFLFKWSLALLVFLTVFVMALCFVHVFDNVVTYRDKVPRYSLGFYHSNVLPLIILYLTMYYHVEKSKITFLSFVIFEVLGVAGYVACKSRNSFLAMQLFFVLMFVTSKMNRSKHYKLFLFICRFVIIFTAALSLVLLYLYAQNAKIAIIANEVFNNRIYMADLYYHFQDFKLMNLMTSDHYKRIALTLDNGYYYTTARYGALFLLVVYWLLNSLAVDFRNKRNKAGLVAVIIITLSNFIDNGLYSYLFLPFMIYSINAGVGKDIDSISSKEVMVRIQDRLDKIRS